MILNNFPSLKLLSSYEVSRYELNTNSLNEDCKYLLDMMYVITDKALSMQSIFKLNHKESFNKRINRICDTLMHYIPTVSIYNDNAQSLRYVLLQSRIKLTHSMESLLIDFACRHKFYDILVQIYETLPTIKQANNNTALRTAITSFENRYETCFDNALFKKDRDMINCLKYCINYEEYDFSEGIEICKEANDTEMLEWLTSKHKN